MSLNGDRAQVGLLFDRLVDEMREALEELESDFDALDDVTQRFVLGLRAAIDEYDEAGE